MEDCYRGKATERIFALLQLQLPEVVISICLWKACSITVLALAQLPRQAKKVMGYVGMGQMMFAKFIVVVDETVDVQNVSR